MIVSNAGPLIHLSKIGKLNLLKELFVKIIIPTAVKVEVVDSGKEEGFPDALLIESEIGKWIEVEEDVDNEVKEIADKAGLDRGEAVVIMLAKMKGYPVLIDDLAARRFAIGLGLEVVGSIGVLIKAAKIGEISKDDALKALKKLGEIMWLGVDVYEDARKTLEELR
jgi:predicted nucleic acid-binding protein